MKGTGPLGVLIPLKHDNKPKKAPNKIQTWLYIREGRSAQRDLAVVMAPFSEGLKSAKLDQKTAF